MLDPVDLLVFRLVVVVVVHVHFHKDEEHEINLEKIEPIRVERDVDNLELGVDEGDFVDKESDQVVVADEEDLEKLKLEDDIVVQVDQSLAVQLDLAVIALEAVAAGSHAVDLDWYKKVVVEEVDEELEL